MDIVINYWAVLGAAIVMMVLGSLWYGPIFGKPWMKLLGLTRETMRTKPGMLSVPVAMTLMFVCTFVIAYVMAHFIALVGARTEGDALQFAFWAWLGFIVPTFASFVIFEQRHIKLFLINVSYYLVSFAAAAYVLARWP